MNQIETKPKKSKKRAKKVEIEKPSRPERPPHKGTDLEGWTNWYKETVKEMIAKGKTISEISKELRIREDSVKAFIS